MNNTGPSSVRATLRGRVARATDRAPIAGAIVTITSIARSDADRVPVVVETGAEGEWHVPVEPGAYVIAASARGFVTAAAERVEVTRSEAGAAVTLWLERGGTRLSGVVTDVRGGPVDGARVRATRLGGGVATTAISDAAGAYEMTVLDEVHHVEAGHAAFATASTSVDVAGAPVTADFALVPGATIEGTAFARGASEPLADVVIVAAGREVARTRDDGTFVAQPLEPGTIELAAYARGYATTTAITVELAPGERQTGVRIVLDGALAIAGRVVAAGDPARGVPMATIEARRVDADAMLTTHATSDDEGRFEVPVAHAGRYVVTARSAGFVPAAHPVVTVGGVGRELVIALKTGVTLSGKVFPPRVARISLATTRDQLDATPLATEHAFGIRGSSDATGAFALAHVPPGRFAIVAIAGDGVGGSVPVVVAADDQANLVIPMSPRGSIAGRVIDRAGAPIGGVYVFAAHAHAPGATPAVVDLERTGVHSSRDGSFRLRGLDAGAHLLIAEEQGRTTTIDLVLAAGEQRRDVTIVVPRRDGVIRGDVVDRDGMPVVHAWVVATRDGGDWRRETMTDAAGQFAIERLLAGRYEVTAMGPRGSGFGAANGVTPGQPARIELAPMGRLDVTVTAGGRPVPAFAIWCDDLAANGTDGAIAFEALVPGAYACTVEAPGGTARATVHVRGRTQLALELRAWASVSGTVVGALTGAPLAGIDVGVDDEEARTDGTGRFTLRVPAGDGALMVSDGLPLPLTHPFRAEPGHAVELGTIRAVPPLRGDAGTFGIASAVRGDALVVTGVRPGGPAGTAGLRAGDAIVAIEGHAVRELGPRLAARLLATAAIGQTLTIDAARASFTLTATRP